MIKKQKTKKTYYKITNIAGKDFYSNSIEYKVGMIIEAPDWKKTKKCGNGLHILDDINKIKNITGLKLPFRVFKVRVIGDFVKFKDKIKCRKLKVIKELTIKEINNQLTNIELISNSSAILHYNSSAELYDNSSAILYNNSSAILYNNSSAILYDNSLAELYDNSVIYIYSKKATFIPHSTTCVVILPNKKVFTFKKAQLGKKYKIVGDSIIQPLNWLGYNVIGGESMKIQPHPLDLKRCFDWAECQDNLTKEDMLEQLKEDIETEIKEACEFYLRYKDNPELLIKEHPEYEKEVKNKFYHPNVIDAYSLWSYDKYNEWLFKSTFKGISKEK